MYNTPNMTLRCFVISYRKKGFGGKGRRREKAYRLAKFTDVYYRSVKLAKGRRASCSTRWTKLSFERRWRVWLERKQYFSIFYASCIESRANEFQQRWIIGTKRVFSTSNANRSSSFSCFAVERERSRKSRRNSRLFARRSMTHACACILGKDREQPCWSGRRIPRLPTFLSSVRFVEVVSPTIPDSSRFLIDGRCVYRHRAINRRWKNQRDLTNIPRPIETAT